ncbi:MAG: hypothetical protein E6I16_04505 [Chloroflexi bacterium]|nr:MAG: hypothetical protein E6I16_04505 [Chloroflexota bacterium]
MGDLPGPPTALYYVLDAVGLVVLALGLYSLVTGRILLKLGRLKQLSTPGAVRVIGLSILLICLPYLWANWELDRALHDLLAGIIASGCLQWWAYRVDRRRGRLPSPSQPGTA